MSKSIKFLSVLLSGIIFCLPVLAASEKTPIATSREIKKEPTTRPDAVIFKIHDVTPVSTDGVVTGCDFSVTLYNRTAVNFRSFTIDLQWNDVVDERFKFNKYVESILGAEEVAKQKDLLGEEMAVKPLKTAITVNAFGADKQITVKSHVDNEKCYLMLSEATYNVSPCDIARNLDNNSGFGLNNGEKECTKLFQLVSTSNPEYFGQFKKISATEIAAQDKEKETRELSDIDVVIQKIVENLGASDKTLTNIN